MALRGFTLATFIASSLAIGIAMSDRVARADTLRGNFTEAGDTEAMRLAIARARASLPEFLRLASNRPNGFSQFAVKFGIRTPKGIEYIWAQVAAIEDRHVRALVDVDVRWSTSVRDGDAMNLEIGDIIDWLYIEGGRMNGNTTLCAINEDQRSHERTELIRRFGIDCDWLKVAKQEQSPEARR